MDPIVIRMLVLVTIIVATIDSITFYRIKQRPERLTLPIAIAVILITVIALANNYLVSHYQGNHVTYFLSNWTGNRAGFVITITAKNYSNGILTSKRISTALLNSIIVQRRGRQAQVTYGPLFTIRARRRRSFDCTIAMGRI